MNERCAVRKHITAELELVLCAVLPASVFGRTWRDATGKFSVEAELLGVTDDGVVRLLRADGKAIEVSVERL
jgi:hypothetical protein